MKFANRVKFTVAITSAGTITPPTAANVTGYRTLAQAIAAGDLAGSDTGIPFVIEDAAGNWEESYFTISADGLTMTRTAVAASSAGGTTAATFTGTPAVFCTPFAAYLASLLSTANGVGIKDLTDATPSTGLLLECADPTSGNSFKISIANLLALGSGGTGADTTPPTFVSAQVANASPTVIQITMSETLGATLPAASAFSVSGGKTVSSVAISGAVVSLTCSTAYANGDTITATYTKPSSGNQLQDAAGNAAATFGPSSVTNNVAATDTTPPTAVSAAVANATPTVVTITMSEAMSTSFVPSAAAFTVSGHTIASVAISGSTISLTVSAAFANGEAARTVAYTQPGTNNARDVVGNLLANFTGLAIANNVAASGGTTTYMASRYDGGAIPLPAGDVTTGTTKSAAGNSWVSIDATVGISNVGYQLFGLAPAPAKIASGWGPSNTNPPALVVTGQTQTGSNVQISAGYVAIQSPGAGSDANHSNITPPTWAWLPGTPGTYSLYYWLVPCDASGNAIPGAAICVDPTTPWIITVTA